MASVRVASTTDIPPGNMKKLTAGGTVILLANVNGTFYALNNRCPHLGGSLADGTLNGDVVTCPRHRSQYNVMTGQNVGKAHLGPLQVKPGNARSYAVKVEGTDIFVELP